MAQLSSYANATPIWIASGILFDGRIQIRQPACGYRFSMDAVVLAQNAVPENGARILDIGTGCGVIPIIIRHLHPETEITGVELQKELADLAAANVSENNMADGIKILHMDARKLVPADTNGRFDMVISNPPYTAAGKGRINPCRQQALARHEIGLSLNELIDAANRMLKNSGKVIIIYPAYRLNELTGRMRIAGIEPETINMVHTKPGLPAKRALVTGIVSAGKKYKS